MKKILLFALAIASMHLNVHAQKGTWFIGANAGYFQQKYKATDGSGITNGVKIISWIANPDLGLFVSDHVQIGFRPMFLSQTIKSVPSNDTSSTTNIWAAGFYGRYFFANGRFRPFIGLSISEGVIGRFDREGNSKSAGFDANSFDAKVDLGFAYAINKKLYVLGSLGAIGYNRTKNWNSGSIITSFGLYDVGTLGPRLNMGIYYSFSR